MMFNAICCGALPSLFLVALLAGCADPESVNPVDLPYQGKPGVQGPPEHVVGSFEANLPDLVLEPAEETLPCWIIPLQIQGPSTLVGGARLTPGPGLHHGNVTSRPKTGEGIRPCDAMTAMGGSEALDLIKGGTWLFASSTQVEGEEWQSFRPGYGLRVNPDHEIVAHMHYLNASSERITVAPRYTWYTIDESTVEHVVAPFGFIFGGFQIPPHSEMTVTGNCVLPKPFRILHLMPHMHALGTAFTAEFLGGKRDGELFLDSQGYDPDKGVSVQYDPTIDLSVADGVRFSCTWQNHFDKTIVEGVGDNEMCMLFGYGFPPDQLSMGFAHGTGDCATIALPAP